MIHSIWGNLKKVPKGWWYLSQFLKYEQWLIRGKKEREGHFSQRENSMCRDRRHIKTLCNVILSGRELELWSGGQWGMIVVGYVKDRLARVFLFYSTIIRESWSLSNGVLSGFEGFRYMLQYVNGQNYRGQRFWRVEKRKSNCKQKDPQKWVITNVWMHQIINSLPCEKKKTF